MTRVIVVVRRRAASRATPQKFAAASLLAAAVAAIMLGVGIALYCTDEFWCDNQKILFIISGSCFAGLSVLLLIFAICLHIKIKRAMRANQQPFTVSPEYPAQRVISFPVMPTQDPPPYSPTTGPMPYPLSPPTKQDPPQAGFVADSQSTESFPQDGTHPPPYSP